MKRGDDIELGDGRLIIEAEGAHPRSGWSCDAKRIAKVGDEQQVLGEFGTQDDAELTW